MVGGGGVVTINEHIITIVTHYYLKIHTLFRFLYFLPNVAHCLFITTRLGTPVGQELCVFLSSTVTLHT